jgi:hypothetical protein
MSSAVNFNVNNPCIPLFGRIFFCRTCGILLPVMTHFIFKMVVILNVISFQPLSGGLGNWPWCGRDEGGLADRRYRYCLTSISNPERRCIGFARRRIGRGGRCVWMIELRSIQGSGFRNPFSFLYYSEHVSVFL